MRIVRVAAYRQLQPFRDGAVHLPGAVRGRHRLHDRRARRATTASSASGEMAPLGAFYAPAFAAGTRAGVAELAPAAAGARPARAARVRRLRSITRCSASPYVKSALDMAVHDLAAQAGRRARSAPTSAAASARASISTARSRRTRPRRWPQRRGLRRRRLPPHPGQGRRRSGAGRRARARGARGRAGRRRALLRRQRRLDDRAGARVPARDDATSRSRSSSRACPTTTAAPCARTARTRSCSTSASTRSRRCSRPTATASPTASRSRSRASAASARRRCCATWRSISACPVTVEDTGGSDIDTAAMAQLSLSTPEELRIHTVDFNAWVTVGNATGMPPAEGGRLRAPEGPGLGVEVQLDALGEPFGVRRVADRARRPPGTRAGGDDAGGERESADDERALEIGIERRHDHAVAQHREAADERQGEQDRRPPRARPARARGRGAGRSARPSPDERDDSGDERAPRPRGRWPRSRRRR